MKKNYNLLKKITVVVFLSSFSLSCDPNLVRKPESAEAGEQQQTEPNISYGDLVIKEQSDYLMIPVNFREKNQAREDALNFSRSYKQDYASLSNLIFYRKQDGETHLLLDNKAVINSFDLIETKLVGQPPTRVWFYKIIDQDTNKDQQLNQEDTVIGYISDLSGKNLQQVTPNNTKIINWVVVPSQNAIFIKIIKDSDIDNKFTAADKTNFIRVNLENPSVGTEIISDQIDQQIKSYILK
ncbi:MAG: hypothetical protein KME59_26590 [Trichormus sp. ATA11-4-KO1]|jgi:hypothetical protein|nr:hypothetical protein [Trichormus sp. ATA11-4-KO1]